MSPSEFSFCRRFLLGSFSCGLLGLLGGGTHSLSELVSSVSATCLLTVSVFSCALVWFGFFLEEQHYLSVLCVWS